ncbi:hypothetical protein RvY_12282 [Ramazzottius varieornatus]|uniref:Uncharacterized protein n=1 Tax=Ramazzottius varieornatus TaxID=947166 RepID=A0A1D1VRL7_RAMVA|nr:hypothetical protein RvY_12282 [Ramazzottius varieornatus]
MVFLLFVVLSFVGSHFIDARPEPELRRAVRQAVFGGNLPSQVQVISLLPTENAQSIATCFQLNKQIPPTGCVFVPNLVEGSTGRLVSCRLVCLGDTTEFVVPPVSQDVAEFLPADVPYLQGGQFRTSDQAGDSAVESFSGESYGFILSATTTTLATATPKTTTTGSTSRADQTSTSTSTTTTPATTLVPLKSSDLVSTQVQACTGTKSAGCTFNPVSCGVCCRSNVPKPAEEDCNFPPELRQIAACLADSTQALDAGSSFINTGILTGAATCGTIGSLFKPGG